MGRTLGYLAISMLIGFALKIRAEEKQPTADEVRKDPKMAQYVWTTLLCLGQEKRAEALAAIAKEKKYARIGGVVKMARMSELQDDVRDADEKIEKARDRLKKAHVKAGSCKWGSVADFVECAKDWEAGNAEGECLKLDLEQWMRLLDGED